MKIIAKREAILTPLQTVIGVVERRQTMPILANVLLAAKGGKLSITATDLEVELVATSEVDVQRAGEVTVPGRKLLDICRALPEGVEITMTLEGERMTVRARKSRFTLSTLPATEFPTVEEINATQTLEVPLPELRRLLEKRTSRWPSRMYGTTSTACCWKRRLKCFDLSRLTVIVSHYARLTSQQAGSRVNRSSFRGRACSNCSGYSPTTPVTRKFR
jgi:hypothetical protein